MSEIGSVTQWIQQLEKGEDDALARLCQRYEPQLEAFVRRRFPDAPHDADEEEVVVSTFWEVYRAIREGRTTCLANRYHFWALLSQIAVCRMVNEIERTLAQKRGGGRVRSLSALLESGGAHEEGAVPAVDGETPLEETILRDTYDHYLGALPEPLRPFAELYLAGYQQKEIAQQMDCSQKTVGRKLKIVFLRWQQMAERELSEPVKTGRGAD